MSKMLFKIIASSFFILIQYEFNTIVKGMVEDQYANDYGWREAYRHITGHCNYVRKTDTTVLYYDPTRRLHPFQNIDVNDFNPTLENYKRIPHLNKFQNNTVDGFPQINSPESERLLLHHGLNAVSDCQACIQAYSDIKEIVLKKHNLNKQQKQEQLKREQEESQRRVVQKQNEQRIQQEKYQEEQEKQIREKEKATKERDLEQRVRQLEKENEELRKNMLSLSVQNSSSSTSPTQIIPEDQVAGHCVSALLRKDPQIFFPWVLTKKISELMEAEFSSDKSSLPANILVEGGKSLVSYVKEELEKGLDVEIVREGKTSFKKMVSSIAAIQGDFWTGSDGKVISSILALLKKLNEGNMGQEWVTGWNSLEIDYKKYIAATVLYRISNDALPKEYKDIEPYLM